jgi:hypothetical protein
VNQKLLWVSGVILALVISLVPFSTTLVPEWQMRVVNESGMPYAGKGVRQFCYSYTLGVSPCHDSNDFMRETDASGYVVFPERKITASLLSRILRTIYNFVMLIADGSFGESVYVDATGPNGYKRLEYLHGRPPPEIFVLP